MPELDRFQSFMAKEKDWITSEQLRRLLSPVRLLLIYSIIITFLYFGSPSSSTAGPSQSYLLPEFQTSISYRTESPPKDAWHSSLYTGEPSPQVERAWHQLLNKGNHGYSTKISKSEAALLGFAESDSKHLSDGRVLSAPAVYHNLHCLRRVRQLLYFEKYYPNASPGQWDEDRQHALHCMETIRASLVCKPDLSLLRVMHVEGDKEPYKAAPAPLQRCVDWESLVAIVNSRNR